MGMPATSTRTTRRSTITRPSPGILAHLADVCFLCQPAVFFRRRVVERFGPLDQSLYFCMDYEYRLRLGRGGAQFAHLPRLLAGSRFDAANKTLRGRAAFHAEINGMLERRSGCVPDLRCCRGKLPAKMSLRSTPRNRLILVLARQLFSRRQKQLFLAGGPFGISKPLRKPRLQVTDCQCSQRSLRGFEMALDWDAFVRQQPHQRQTDCIGNSAAKCRTV